MFGFTSRLPISTSVRRPNGTTDASKSFVASQRQSNIPVTVKKANLFTPQTKRPFQSGASTAGKSFMSGATTDKKYQRVALKPMPDREEQVKMFDNLVDYLKMHAPQFPLPEAKKFFLSVSTTETVRLFEFLISRHWPEFKINKLETDVPEALNHLEYPYVRAVTRSALVSVTTRQAVVGLLRIFDWLVNYNKEIEQGFEEVLENAEDPEDEFTDDSSGLLKIVLSQPLDASEECRALFDSKHKILDADAMMTELRNLGVESDAIQEYLEQFEDLNIDRQTVEEDLEKCREYLSSMQNYIDNKKNEEEQKKQQLIKVNILEEDQTKRLEALEHEIRNHEYNTDEVRTYRVQLDSVQARLAALRDKFGQETEVRERIETQCSRAFERLKEVNNQILTLLKELEHIYDSNQNFDSTLLAEILSGLKDWIVQMDQSNHTDLEQGLVLQRELTLNLQKLEATNSCLETEIKSGMYELNERIKELEMATSKYPNDILPKLREDLKIRERDAENDKCHFMSNFAKIEAQIESEDNSMAHLLEVDKELTRTLLKEREIEFNALQTEREDMSALDELDLQHQRLLMDKNTQEVMNIFKDVANLAQRAREASEIAEENNRIARAALRMFKKRGIIS